MDNLKNHESISIISSSILIFFVVVVLIFNLFKTTISIDGKSSIYIDIMRMSIPGIQEETSENQKSLAESALEVLGTNIKSPLSILKKEMSSLVLGAEIEGTTNQVILAPYALGDGEVVKAEGTPLNSEVAQVPSNNQVVDTIDKTYDPSLKAVALNPKPDVFIYHTHTCESYKPGPQTNTDPTQSVVAVGDELSNILQTDYNISVVHDKTVHDLILYNSSYERSAVTVDKNIKKYGDFKLVIDLHRDSIEDKATVTKQINGESVSKMELVMAKNNPHFTTNMVMANKIVETSNKFFPGLCRGIYYYDHGTRFFNQDKSNNSVLVEVGSQVNTITESKNTAKYLARVIAEVLNRK